MRPSPDPSIEAEDPVGLLDRVPTLDEGEVEPIDHPGLDSLATELGPKGRYLILFEAHQRLLTERVEPPLERTAPGTASRSCRLSFGG